MAAEGNGARATPAANLGGIRTVFIHASIIPQLWIAVDHM